MSKRRTRRNDPEILEITDEARAAWVLTAALRQKEGLRAGIDATPNRLEVEAWSAVNGAAPEQIQHVISTFEAYQSRRGNQLHE